MLQHRLVVWSVGFALGAGLLGPSGASGSNLLINGGAETGELAPWTASSGAIQVVQSREQGAPYPTVYPYSGQYFFSFLELRPGGHGATVSMYQEGTTGLSATQFRLSLLMQTVTRPGLPTDFGRADLLFFDSDGNELEDYSSSTGDIDNSPDNGEWRLYELSADVPIDADKWRVELFGTLADGILTNVFYEDVTLVPEPSTLALLSMGALLCWSVFFARERVALLKSSPSRFPWR